MPNLLKLGIVVAMLCTALAACHTRHKSACHIRQSHLREGDVIFRRGTSANSRMVTLLQGFTRTWALWQTVVGMATYALCMLCPMSLTLRATTIA